MDVPLSSVDVTSDNYYVRTKPPLHALSRFVPGSSFLLSTHNFGVYTQVSFVNIVCRFTSLTMSLSHYTGDHLHSYTIHPP